MNDNKSQNNADNFKTPIVFFGPQETKMSPAKLGATISALAVIVALFGLGFYLLAISPHSKLPITKSASAAPLYIPSQVNITSSGFIPATISVNLGQAVVWTNKDTSPHVVASDPFPSDNILPALNSNQQIDTNDSYTYIFNRKGTFTYHDNLNPSLEGTVIVK